MNSVLYAFVDVVDVAFTLLTWAIVIRAVLSWVQPDPFNPVVRFLTRVTDPILLPVQRIIPPLGGIDLSPIVALLLIQLVQRAVVTALARLLLG